MTENPSHTLRAMRLEGASLPDDTAGSSFVGVRCRNCGVVYAVEVPRQRGVAAIPVAIEWAEDNMGSCGRHPDLILESN